MAEVSSNGPSLNTRRTVRKASDRVRHSMSIAPGQYDFSHCSAKIQKVGSPNSIRVSIQITRIVSSTLSATLTSVLTMPSVRGTLLARTSSIGSTSKATDSLRE